MSPLRSGKYVCGLSVLLLHSVPPPRTLLMMCATGSSAAPFAFSSMSQCRSATPVGGDE